MQFALLDNVLVRSRPVSHTDWSSLADASDRYPTLPAGHTQLLSCGDTHVPPLHCLRWVLSSLELFPCIVLTYKQCFKHCIIYYALYNASVSTWLICIVATAYLCNVHFKISKNESLWYKNWQQELHWLPFACAWMNKGVILGNHTDVLDALLSSCYSTQMFDAIS